MSDIVCSIARTLDVVGERWTPLILRDLFVGLNRFEDIRRDLGIATNVLTARLETLQQHGIVETRAYQSNPVRYEYVLTDQGRDLYPVLTMLITWGDKWLAPEGPPALVVHDDCGRITSGIVTCTNCHTPDRRQRPLAPRPRRPPRPRHHARRRLSPAPATSSRT